MGCLLQCGSAVACACCTSVLNFTLSQASRFGHMLVVLTTFTLAIILGTSFTKDINGYNYYTKINLLGGCASDFEDNCMYRQLIYRASLSLFVLFSFLALTSYGSDMINRSFWMMKFGLAVGLFVAFWWVDNSTFSQWAEFARVVSFGWLLVQGLLLIDFSHDAHDLLMHNTEYNEDNRSPFVVYLLSSAIALAAAGIGLAFLFMDYTGCDVGMFFTLFTLFMGVFTTIVSLLNSVNKGLLTPCIMFAYSVFLCWYALLSNPHDSCNPTASSISGSQTAAIVIVGVVSVVIMLYCVINGTKILNIFNPNVSLSESMSFI
jgi:serine incorporator 1/3